MYNYLRGDLVWQRQVGAGEQYRQFYSVCKDHLVGKNCIFQEIRRNSITRAKNERSMWQGEAGAIGWGQATQVSGTHEGF